MTSESTFQPNWASPPGDTISDILFEKNISLKEFSNKMGFTTTYTKKIINGNISITYKIAENLESILGASKTFWINRESQYREDIVRAEQNVLEQKEWLSELPLSDMRKFGWAPTLSNSKFEDKLNSCFNFFNVSSVKEWHEIYHDLLYATSFKISSSFDSKAESIITWLRQGEIDSQSSNCSNWNKELFKKSLLEIRPLTRQKDPQIFIPKIKELFSRCGVALAIVPTPTKCTTSGATYFTSNNKALLLLSFRHLSDDHFWFSLYHEAGHILLHKNTSIFLEGIEKSTSKEEKEANDFAAKILIPEEHQPQLMTLNANKWRDIVRFAKLVGVSSGIVVGQLQHLGLIRHNQLNKLKTRFKWIKS